MLNAILWDFHQGRNYSRGSGDARNSLKKETKHDKACDNQALLKNMDEIG